MHVTKQLTKPLIHARKCARPRCLAGRWFLNHLMKQTLLKETYFGSPPQSHSSNSHAVPLLLLVTCGFSNSRILEAERAAASLLWEYHTFGMPPAPQVEGGWWKGSLWNTDTSGLTSLLELGCIQWCQKILSGSWPKRFFHSVKMKIIKKIFSEDQESKL